MLATESPSVAVVDDDPDVRRAMLRLLSSAGIEGMSYASGTEFVHREHQRRPGCVVLDLHMPGLNGFDVQQHLLEHDASVPLIVITGRDTAETRRRAINLGARAYFPRPVDGEALLHAIGVALGQAPDDPCGSG